MAAAAAVDVAVGVRAGDLPVVAGAVLLLAVGVYAAGRSWELVWGATSEELATALARSARMIRLPVRGGPVLHELGADDGRATLRLARGPGGMHCLFFGGCFRRPKIQLFRTVVAKQFGGLIPILFTVRT